MDDLFSSYVNSHFGSNGGQESHFDDERDRLSKLINLYDVENAPPLYELRAIAAAELTYYRELFSAPENVTDENTRKFLDKIDMIASHGELLRELWEFVLQIQHEFFGQGLADIWNALIMTLGRHLLDDQSATSDTESAFIQLNIQKMQMYGIKGKSKPINIAFMAALDYTKKELQPDVALLTCIEYLGSQVHMQTIDVLHDMIEQGLELLESAKHFDNIFAVFRAHVLLARTYHKAFEFEQAFTHSQQAYILSSYLEQSNTGFAMLCTMLSSIVYSNSLVYGQQLLMYTEAAHQKASRTLMNDANYYGTIGYYLYHKGQYREAIHPLSHAQLLYEKLEHLSNLITVSNLLATCYAFTDQFNLAEHIYRMVTTRYMGTDKQERLPQKQRAIAIHGLGWMSLKKGNRELSIYYLKEGFDLVTQMSDSPWRTATLDAIAEDLTAAKSLPQTT